MFSIPTFLSAQPNQRYALYLVQEFLLQFHSIPKSKKRIQPPSLSFSAIDCQVTNNLRKIWYLSYTDWLSIHTAIGHVTVTLEVSGFQPRVTPLCSYTAWIQLQAFVASAGRDSVLSIYDDIQKLYCTCGNIATQSIDPWTRRPDIYCKISLLY